MNPFAKAIENQKGRIRFETSGLLAIVILLGWLSSVGLFHLGFGPLWARYLVSATMAYGLFVVFYWVWMRALIADIGANLERYSADPGPRDKKKSGWDFDLSFADGFDLEGIGLLVGVLAILAVAGFVLVTAPAMVLDVLMSEALLFFVAKRLRSVDETAVLGTILTNTVLAFLILCVVLVVWALALQIYFPEQDSFSSILVEFFRRLAS